MTVLFGICFVLYILIYLSFQFLTGREELAAQAKIGQENGENPCSPVSP